MLKYKSVHELEQHSGLPEALQRKMLNDRMTLEETLKKVDTLKKAAKKERMHGNVENEYSYLFRICEICILVTQRHPILKRTVTNASPDSRRLRDVWKSTLKDLDEVSIRLNKLYSERTPMNAVQVPQNEVQPQVPTTPEKPPLPSCLIMPMDLVKFVEDKQEPKTALIVDFREQKTLIVKFKKETQITVLDVPRDCIKRPLIFETLIQSVAVGERAPLTKLSSFNKIVLLDSGDEADPVDENGEIRGDSIARLLYAALYEYNMRSLPKSAPVYMKGGFKNWRTTYPMYTASADGSAKMSWGSDEGNISKAIAALRKSRPAAFEMEYPDLMAKPKPTPLPRQPSPVQQVEPKSPAQPIAPTSSSEDLHAPLAKIQVTQPSVYLPSRPASPSVAPSVPTPAAVVPKPEPPRGPPVFDRSAKPKETTFDARVPGEALQANVQVVSSREVPQVPSLPVAPARPSVDRSTKEAVARKEADFQRDLLAVYEVCTQDLRNMSRYARVQPGYTGLVNITNTCFMNSTLQALANTPPLRELFTVRNFARHVNRYSKRGTQGEISAAFTALLDTLWCGEFTALNPQVFRSIFAHSVNRFLANGQQHDAAEFENVLIDALHEDTNSVSCPKQIIYPDFTGENIHADSMKYESISKQFSDSPINSIFNLHTVAPKRCTSCGRQTVNFSAQLCITMDIPLDGETTVEDCLTRSFSAESIEVQCVFCKKTQRMSRHTKLWKLPKVLVIQLKRFGEYGNALRKNEINVRFGNHLSLKPFMHDQADVSKSVYSLYSVTNHVGNLNSGHYYAYVKNPVTKQWLEFNDEAVKPMSEDSLQSRAAFVLYYTNT